jgi:hypothetical protein
VHQLFTRLGVYATTAGGAPAAAAPAAPAKKK